MTGIKIPQKASDYIAPSDFEGVKFVNVENAGMALFFEPPKKWAIIKDCGAFPCTAPKNVLYSFKGVTVEGANKPALNGDSEFQIIPDVKDSGPYSSLFPTCKPVTAWKGYLCKTEGLGILLFESGDPDTFDRSI